MDLLPPQVCGRLWLGCRLVVCTCLHQLIALIFLKYPSISLLNNSFVDCLLVCIIFIRLAFIDSGIFPRVC